MATRWNWMASMTTEVGSTASRSAVLLIVGLGGLYVGQSVIGSMIFTGLPAVMRKSGASLNEIAFTLLAVLPWSFKFVWAPAVERFRSPHGGLRRSRLTVSIVGAFAVVAVGAFALIGPTALVPLSIAMIVATFASATVDIACDGHAVETLAEKNRGWGNAVQMGGAYVGAALGGGLFLVLIDQFGWRNAGFVMAASLVALALPFLLTPDGARVTGADRPPQSLMRAFRRPEVRSGLLLVALYVFGQKWAMTLTGPFLVDTGLSLTTIGALNGVGITVLGLMGCAGGGYVLRRYSPFFVMAFALCGQIAAMLALSASAYLGVKSPYLLLPTMMASSIMFALGFVALYSELMGRASLDQAGVDFTLFQSADSVVSLIGWQLAATVGETLGYAACFGAAGVFGLTALVLMKRVVRGS